jgi:hypothetical protein
MIKMLEPMMGEIQQQAVTTAVSCRFIPRLLEVLGR